MKEKFFSISVWRCPDSQCTQCLTYNSTAQWGICTNCSVGYEVEQEKCWLSCGDGLWDVNEVCDDGNRVNGDGCSSTC